jgi:hypothetical protein
MDSELIIKWMAKRMSIVLLPPIEIAITNLEVTRDLLLEEYKVRPHTSVYSVITGLNLELILLKKLI